MLQESGATLASSSAAGGIMSAINRHGTVVLEGNTRDEPLSLASTHAGTSTLVEPAPTWRRRQDPALDDLRASTDAAFEALELQDPSQLFDIPASCPADTRSNAHADLADVCLSLQQLKAGTLVQSSFRQAMVASVLKQVTQDGLSASLSRAEASSGTRCKHEHASMRM